MTYSFYYVNADTGELLELNILTAERFTRCEYKLMLSGLFFYSCMKGIDGQHLQCYVFDHDIREGIKEFPVARFDLDSHMDGWILCIRGSFRIWSVHKKDGNCIMTVQDILNLFVSSDLVNLYEDHDHMLQRLCTGRVLDILGMSKYRHRSVYFMIAEDADEIGLVLRKEPKS